MRVIDFNPHTVNGLAESLDTMHLQLEHTFQHVKPVGYQSAQDAIADAIYNRVHSRSNRILGEKFKALHLGVGLGLRVIHDTAEAAEGGSKLIDYLRATTNGSAISDLAMREQAPALHPELQPLRSSIGSFYDSNRFDIQEVAMHNTLTDGGLRLSAGLADTVADQLIQQGIMPQDLGVPLKQEAQAA